jgi:adenylylsulfate kinase-like enzyme
MNEEDIGDITAQAEAAKALLQNPVFNAAFENMNEQIMGQILATPVEASEERERLYTMYKAGQLFVQQFAGIINNYELAKQPEVM